MSHKRENRDKVYFWKSQTGKDGIERWLRKILNKEFPGKRNQIRRHLLEGKVEEAEKEYKSFIDNYIPSSTLAENVSNGEYSTLLEYLLHENYDRFTREAIDKYYFEQLFRPSIAEKFRKA